MDKNLYLSIYTLIDLFIYNKNKSPVIPIIIRLSNSLINKHSSPTKRDCHMLSMLKKQCRLLIAPGLNKCDFTCPAL